MVEGWTRRAGPVATAGLCQTLEGGLEEGLEGGSEGGWLELMMCTAAKSQDRCQAFRSPLPLPREVTALDGR